MQQIKSLEGARLYAVIAVVCVAGGVGIAIGLEYSAHFTTPGYIPPEKVAPTSGPCYSFELNCSHAQKHSAGYYTTGRYLDPTTP